MGIQANIINEGKNLIEAYGFRKFTMDQLAKQLRISKKTIYENFSSKDKLISAIVDSIIEKDAMDLKEQIDQQTDYVEKLRAIFYLYNIKMLKKAYVSELQSYFPKEWNKLKAFSNNRKNYVRKIYQEGIENGVFIKKFKDLPNTPIKIDLHHTVDLLIFFLTSIIDQAVETELVDYDFDINTMLIHSYELIIQMFLVKKEVI